MASERQIAANRRNALKSTGPQTKIGKERASKNAYCHGLRSRPTLTRSQAKEIEELARELAGDTKSPIVPAWARTAAEATFELIRVRRTRVALIEQVSGLGKLSPRLPFSALNEIRLLRRWLKQSKVLPSEPGLARPENLPADDRTAEGVRCLLPELDLLARYERRAWSRREKALQAPRNPMGASDV
jgi:hypothetical protein